MSHNSIQRPALGQWADLGALYDARTDNFVPHSLLRSQPSEDSVSVTSHATRRVLFLSGNNYKEKFNDFKIGIELGASVLSGMTKVAGAAEYLEEARPSTLVGQTSINYVVTTCEERVGFGAPGLTEFITLDAIKGSGATHVLAAIGWGAQAIVAAKYPLTDGRDQERVKAQIGSEFNRIETIIRSEDEAMLNQQNNQSSSSPMEITIYSDVISEPGRTSDLRQACDFILQVRSRAAGINDGKGLPIQYTLMPLELLSYMLNVEIKPDVAFSQPGSTFLEGFPAFFDELDESQQSLDGYHRMVVHKRHCVPRQYIETVSRCLDACQSANNSLRSDFGRLLKDVRGGFADQTELVGLLEATRAKVAPPQDVAKMTNQYRDKVRFVDQMMKIGINYLGYEARPIETELKNANAEDAYVLYFNEKLRLESESWSENFKLMQKLNEKRISDSVLAMVDCDATGEMLEQVRISRFQLGNLIVLDVLDQIKYGKCVVTCIREDYLDTSDAKKPLRRSAVKIPCPGPACDMSKVQDWICDRCNAPIEYGAAQRYIYCDCGRSPYDNYAFQCKELDHGPHFEPFIDDTLFTFLDSLDPMEELNILIIGETGVGKSTFINAFVNYLSYDSLDNAIKNEELDWLIPCSFNYQTMDRSDPMGKIVQTKIQVGEDRDEVDGSMGSSATQKTMVYPFTQGDTVIRLIDTPGIGDTRGVEKDHENMANILGMLGNFDNLHGILFLLKSNSARLNLMFRFVVEELLMHLHRDAAQNMVFGFTNTRVSNYMPGDTFTPLAELLKKHSRVHIGLFPRTVYCFDSESFRFLAAQKRGVVMDNIQDFRLSWENSTRETKRLIEYFRGLEPHSVRSTLSLNQTRELILHLTKPMADIMQSIEKTIQLNVDNVAELNNRKLKGDQLRKRLHWNRIELVHRSLDHPRTVCNDMACKEYRDDGSGMKQTIYKSHCHKRCYLSGVEVGTVSCSALMNCAAFNGKENCELCGHHWENHLHVLHELEEQMKTVKDEAVEEQLTKNASDITLKETAIQNLKNKIAESDYEYKEIQTAAIKFAVFLQKHSITPYNDAMEDYLNYLIKEEKGKVSMGGPKERLENLERHLTEHVEQRKILRDNIQQGSTNDLLTEAGVETAVDHLYRLKHWGANLRDIKNSAEADHLAEYREKPYRPGRKLRHSSYSSIGRSKGRSMAPSASRFTWIADNKSNGLALTENSYVAARQPRPYQYIPKSTKGMQENMPGHFPEPESTSVRLAAPRRQIVQQQQHLDPPSEAPSSWPELPQRAKSSSLTSKLLRPFTKRF